MQNGDKALPKFLAKPNHRFACLCLNHVKMGGCACELIGNVD